LNYYADSWRRYTDFRGRSSRPAYWWTFLISAIIVFVLGGISASIWDLDSNDTGPLESIYLIAYLIPSIALEVRRLHDVGRSGKWIFIMVTGVGILLLLFWAFSRSRPEDNKWGPGPASVTGDAPPRESDREPKQAQGPSDIIR
jgi:uncharacterized membrane protein YhaH (DUF805 family)